MDYDKIIKRLYNSLSEAQKEVFLDAVRKAAEKDEKYRRLHGLSASPDPSTAPEEE
jgi:hypothetical protein